MEELLSASDLLICANGDHQLDIRETSVLEKIMQLQLIFPCRAKAEVAYFFRNLGVDDIYFQTSNDDEIAEHILALYSAKLLAVTSQKESLALSLFQEKADKALYIVPSMTGKPNSPSVIIEHRIESFYLLEGYVNPDVNKKVNEDVFQVNSAHMDIAQLKENQKSGFRVQVYRTNGAISPNSSTKLRLYFVHKADFPPGEVDETEVDLEKIADRNFMLTTTEHTKELTKQILAKAVKVLGTVTEIHEEKDGEVRLMVAYRANSTHSFFSGITALFHSHGLHSTKKYYEPFKNGYRVFAFFLRRYPSNVLPSGDEMGLMDRVRCVANEISYIYVLPRSSLSDLLYVPGAGGLTAPEVSYAYTIWKFAHQFINSVNEDELEPVRQNLINNNMGEQLKGVFTKVKQSIKREVMTEERIKEVIYDYTDIIKRLYQQFDKTFNPNYFDNNQQEKRVRVENKEEEEKLISLIKKAANSDLDCRILLLFRMFNASILKTNFFYKKKVALSFKLNAEIFLSKVDYPITPFGLFFIVGPEFRGFHVRFVNVARGGIRIIRSGNVAAFAANVSSLFEENYNLAYTQQMKNKDIPEGGAKGTILLSLDHQDKALIAFKKYVNALLDLLLIPNPEIIDYYNDQHEILFLGPDEGTAEYMNWASEHARTRNYAYWKAFTTGKSRSRGGIPHDYYGMTTHSIHEFVLGICRKLNLNESDLRKFQTGGPDGDLGSNEIKISKDSTIAVVDGSGVLYDPNGIDRAALIELANKRLMSCNFDKSKLGPGGFFVGVNDIDITLPNGEYIDKGLIFRNNFHLEKELLKGVDLFVPCGGRPAAVNASNVHLLLDPETKLPRFKYIVEGANLFFTQDARLELEKRGAILFKDASANKGGVTSSSLEVLASLALNDEEYRTHMQVLDDDNPPPFYVEYVKEVLRIIGEHARDEFECLWNDHLTSHIPLCKLTDLLSDKINQLHNNIYSSQLWNNDSLRRKVISLAIPRNLIELVGIDVIMSRVPTEYLKAIFGASLASKFVYSRGLHAGEFAFFDFMSEFQS